MNGARFLGLVWLYCSMLRNYFRRAWRNLQKQKAFAFINVFGLSAGIACFSLLLLFAANEFSFHRFHKNAPNIYGAYVWFDLHTDQPPTRCTASYGPKPIT